MSIRGRLIVLALLAITPLMFERLHALEGVRAERTAGAHAQVIDLARRGAEAQEATISEVRAFLQIIADVYARTPFNQNDCDRYLSSLTTNISWIRTVSVAGTNGQIRCATDPRAVGLNMGDRPHFQHAVHDRRFAVSDYFINTSRQIPSIYAAFPIVGEKGAVVGAVMASINLQWMNKIAA
ncbi:MAG: PDC sensor domain-containing protein, partial [Xanthobacteraceae bacterium]